MPAAGDRRGTVRRRKSGRWQAVFELDRDPLTGKRQKDSLGTFATEREAWRAIDQRRAEYRAGKPAEPSDRLTVAELAERWLESQDGILKPTTHASYSDNVRLHIVPAIGAKKIGKVDAPVVGALADRLRTKVGTEGRGKGHVLSSSSQKYVLRVLSSMFGWAVEESLMPSNPVEAWRKRQRSGTAAARRRRSTSSRGQNLAWTADHVGVFMQAIEGHRFETLFRTTIATGVRRGEVCALRWSDIDFETGRVRFARSRTLVGGRPVEGATKTEDVRVVTLDVGTLEALRRLRTTGPVVPFGDGDVFLNDDGSPVHPQDVTDEFSKVVKATTGLPRFRFHDLRHLSATVLLDAGVGAPTVARRLGHSRTSMTTDIYGHGTDAGDVRAAQELGSLLDRRPSDEAAG